MRLLLGACFLVVLSFTACGKKDEPVKNTQAIDAVGNFRSGVCGTQVVADFRAMHEACEQDDGRRTREEARACRGLAESFLGKYPGINCTAESKQERRGRRRPFSITERQAKEFLERLNRHRH